MRAFAIKCARAPLQLKRAHLCTDLFDIWNYSSKDSNLHPHKISWGSELSLRRYLQNNIDFPITLIFNVFSIFLQFCNSKVKVDNYWIVMEFFEKIKQLFFFAKYCWANIPGKCRRDQNYSKIIFTKVSSKDVDMSVYRNTIMLWLCRSNILNQISGLT